MSVAVDGTVDLFGHEGQARMYAEFRPVYPDSQVLDILNHVPATGRRKYLDVACGSGQLTMKLSQHFERSIGLDRSTEQLSQLSASNIETLAGSAFDFPVDTGAVDLVTVGQGLHWLLPYDKFFDEVNRVLRPGGIFAAVGYAFPSLVHSEAQKHLDHFYFDILGSRLSPGTPGCMWETNRPTVDNQYADIPFPWDDSLEKMEYTEKVPMKFQNYLNYLRTLSAYRAMISRGEPDPLSDLEARIKALLGDVDTLEVLITFFTVIVRKPYI
jgi:ubiquinone/menaquinone biosynthesis C-methylase UbiE